MEKNKNQFDKIFQQKIDNLKKRKCGGLMLYLPLGDPTLKKSLELAEKYVEAGVDFIEVGIPTDDPFMDSNFIKNTMSRALKNEDDYNKYFKAIAKFKKNHSKIPIVVLIYNHLIKSIGIDNFIKKCHKSGVEGIILVGKGDLENTSKKLKKELFVVRYIPHHLPEKEVQKAKSAEGFIYFQATPGNKGKKPGTRTLKDCINYLKNKLDIPIFCGVGISDKEDVKNVIESGADAAIIGSSVLKERNNESKMINKIKALKKASCLNR